MPDQDIQDFQKWFKAEFGKDLPNELALEKMLALVGIMKIVYKPITEQQLLCVQEWRKQKKDLSAKS